MKGRGNLVGQPKPEAEGSALNFSFFRHNRLGLIFLVLFCGIAAGRLLKYSRSEDQRRARLLNDGTSTRL